MMYLNTNYTLPYRAYQAFYSLTQNQATRNPVSLPNFNVFSPASFGNKSFSDVYKPLNTMMSAARDVNSSANNMLSSLATKRTSTSSDTKALTAMAKDSAALKNYSILVKQLASSQKNISSTLNRTSPTAMDAGTNKFSINFSGNTTSLSVNILSTDTNEQALGKVKNAINDANLGIKANLVTDTETDTVKLELTSEQTGTDNQFSIEDEVGNVVSSIGISNVDTEARDALYRVDGGATLTSQSNTITLDNGKVTANLLKEAEAPVRLSVGGDANRIADDVKSFVKEYNAMIDHSNSMSGYLNAQMSRSVKNAIPSYRMDDLRDIGISKRADGTLQVDESKLKESITNNFQDTKRTLESAAYSTKNVASRFTNMPAQSLLDRNVLSYQRYSTYQPSMQFYLPQYTGLLFNQYF